MMHEQRRPRILMISQVYAPDSTAVGQHFAEVAEEMARRGWDVRVLAASRGYSDPRLRFPPRETRNGVDVRRLPLSSFGKRSIPVRLLAQVLFMVQVVCNGLLTPALDAVFVSTSPPFAGFGGAIIGLVRRVPFLWWVMDLNPDQMVVAGKLRPTSLFVRVFDWMNRVTLRRAARVIALDRFMAERLNRKVDVSAKLLVAPPWPLNETPPLDDAGRQRLANAGTNFRKQHGLENCFVVMYSGNHAIQHPLDTLLDAAKQLEGEPSLKFLFIGGGAGKAGVEHRIAAGATNILSLPYQPLETLEESLGAGDLHVVSMGPEVVGIVHPCKIYGAMAVGRPLLFFGPRESHAGEIVEPQHLGWRVEHGDLAATVAAIKQAAGLARPEWLEMGQRAAALITADFSRRHLRNEVCTAVEAMLK